MTPGDDEVAQQVGGERPVAAVDPEREGVGLGLHFVSALAMITLGGSPDMTTS